MRMLFIRHAEPDYIHDSLTEKGFREAELLKERLLSENISYVYLSPLGRAQKTAEPFLKASGLSAQTLPWLREFVGRTKEPYEAKEGVTSCPWNIPPEIWTNDIRNFDRSVWRESDLYRSQTIENYDTICRAADNLLRAHGYRRTDDYYETTDGSDFLNTTIAFFCHLGVANAILSYFMNIPLPVFWHGFFLAPSSVTQVVMEHRVHNSPIAYPRIIRLGDVSHLTASGEPVSTSGFFMKEYQ